MKIIICPTLSKYLHLLVIIVLTWTISSCIAFDDLEDLYVGGEQNISAGVVSLNARAKEISSFHWAPLSDLIRGKVSYLADNYVKGIPYSSVKELDTNVGIETSFYTFATAIGNPRSVIYTENILEEPYHGTNCSLYYGTVCSTTVEYALGIDIPYATSMYDTLSCFTLKQKNAPCYTEIGDVLLSKGHVTLVTNIRKNKNNDISQIQILESSSVGTQAHLRSYKYDSFCSRWDHIGWIAYTYNGIDDIADNDGYVNSVIKKKVCPNKGDKSCYRINEDVVINVMTDEGDVLRIFKDGSCVKDISVKNNFDFVLADLHEGDYRAILLDFNELEIESCDFKVVNCDINIENLDKSLVKVIFPATRYTPYYIAIVDIHGNRYAINLIDDDDIKVGYKIIKVPKTVACGYCKVLFKNEFGQISNYPINIK